MRTLPIIAIWLALASPASGADVRISGDRYFALRPPEAPERKVPSPLVHGARVQLELTDDEVRFVARYQVFAPSAGWLKLPVARAAHVDSVTFRGNDVAITTQNGSTVAAWRAGQSGELVVRGSTSQRFDADLGLMQVPGVVSIEGEAVLAGAPALGDGRFWMARQPVTLARPVRRSRRGDLVFGEAAVGFTVGDADVGVQAQLRWRVAQGQGLERVSFTLPGAGADLEVTGPQVSSWTRSGNRITVELHEREPALVRVRVRWSTPLGSGEALTLTPPVPQLDGTFRTTHALQLARDGTHEVVPQVSGYQPVAGSQLPEWARGLVQGQPTAAFTSGARPSSSVAVYRVTPAQGPSTLIDVAQYTVAATDEGRVLVRAHYAVRNDRGDYLRLTPPPGLDVVGVRVGTETAKLSRVGDEWLIPLARSVETLQGLLTFPVEVTLLGERDRWQGREERNLPLPRVDAPIAVARATVHLPPTYTARKPESSAIVDQFTEGGGITYGFATGDARVAQADSLFQSAVGAWMSNEFDEAEELIADLESLGGDNADIQRLKSNLSYVQEGKSEKGNVAQARRVKEMARARASKDVVEQQVALDVAEERFAEGDYAQAAEAYDKALKLGNKLGKIAADEDKEVDTRNAEVARKLDAAKQLTKSSEEPIVASESRTIQLGFFDDVIDGELVKPEGSFLDVKAGLPSFVPSPDPKPDAEPEPSPVTDDDAPFDFDGGGGSGAAGPVVRNAPAAPVEVSAMEVSGRRSRRLDSATAKPKKKRSQSRRSAGQAGADAAYRPPSPAVTAASLSVVVPSQGEAVRYQRLLLPAGATDAVPIRARPKRRNR